MNHVDTPVRGLKPLMLVATIAALALAVVGAFNRGALGTAAAGWAVGIIVAVPLLRVVVVGAHWWRIGDRRFALISASLLALVGAGAIIASL